MTDKSAEFYNDGYSSVGDLLEGLRDGSLLVHMRVADGKDFRHGIYPSAGSFLRSTEAWQWAEEEYGRGPELTFFSDDLSWADNRNEVLRNSSGKSGALEAVFVERNDDIVKYIEEDKVQLGASGSVVLYYRCSMYDYDDPVMKDIPAGVERGDWFTSQQQDVVAVVPAEMLTEASAIQQVVKALLSAVAELEGAVLDDYSDDEVARYVQENHQALLKAGVSTREKLLGFSLLLSDRVRVAGYETVFWSVVERNLPVASGYIELDDEEDTEDPFFWERNAFVLPAFQRKGIYNAVMAVLRRQYGEIVQDTQHTRANDAFWKRGNTSSAVAELEGADAKKQALSAYIDDFLEATQPHPFDRSSIYKGHTVVELRPFDGRIHLSWIQTLKPKSGAATETMKFLTELADKHGVAMSLSAVPKGKGETKIPKAKLVAFYKRFGFTGHPDEMIREPSVRIRLKGFDREH